MEVLGFASIKTMISVKRSLEHWSHLNNYINLLITARQRKTLRLVVVYRSKKTKTRQSTGPVFLHEFAMLLELLLAKQHYLLISGDFNFHVDDERNRETLTFLDLVNSFNLKQHVNMPTHRHGHTLDIMLTRATDL